MMTATYSPDDNKLRLYSTTRLDPETYARVKAAGFKWAPRQDLFVAPMWTPTREDLMIELCGDIEDEDRSVVDRAEKRAERFEGYSEKRAADAETAHKAVRAIADHIPLGQPILVGHHSERRARKDAEKINNGMRKAVRMWETSTYWTARAAGALRHAKYKELPAVRHRRIKGIEADRRKQEKTVQHAELALKLWKPDLTREEALKLSNAFNFYIRREETEQYPDSVWSLLSKDAISPADAAAKAQEIYSGSIERANRWIAHYDNRLAYERAMLSEQLGGPSSMSERFQVEKGGRVLVAGEWLVVLRVNKANGVVNSVTTTPPRQVTWAKSSLVEIERIKDYKAPSVEDAEKATAATKLPPLCNYPGEGFREMTEAEWKKRSKWSDFSYVRVIDATEQHGRHRARFMPKPGKMWEKQQVFITDAKRVDPPNVSSPAIVFERQCEMPQPRKIDPEPQAQADSAFAEMRRTLAQGGVKAVSVAQLFATPAPIAQRVMALVDIQPGHAVLEPSAGTGALLAALPCVRPSGFVVAVEIDSRLIALLEPYADQVICGNFLEQEGLGLFDRVVMNPPFVDAADIAHIERAASMLKPGGRLVAICANGPRQNDRLRPQSSFWEVLPDGSFSGVGTGVSTALLVIDR